MTKQKAGHWGTYWLVVTEHILPNNGGLIKGSSDVHNTKIKGEKGIILLYSKTAYK